jgi:hypothetical protein
MKAYFKNMIQAYSGTCDGLVYYYNPRLRRIIVRPHVKRSKTAQNDLFKVISAQLKALAPSEGYKRDLAMYVELYNRKAANYRHPLNNWYNAFTQMMWKLAKGEWKAGEYQPATLDLSTITRAFIYDNDLPCISVKRAVEAGILSPVNGYGLLIAEM